LTHWHLKKLTPSTQVAPFKHDDEEQSSISVKKYKVLIEFVCYVYNVVDSLYFSSNVQLYWHYDPAGQL
jgi:hypothetical protein